MQVTSPELSTGLASGGGLRSILLTLSSAAASGDVKAFDVSCESRPGSSDCLGELYGPSQGVGTTDLLREAPVGLLSSCELRRFRHKSSLPMLHS